MAGEALKIQSAEHNPWRKDFPVFSDDPTLVYLDNGASAQKPQPVIDAIAQSYQREYANIHRGLYKYSQVKTEEFEAAREKIARFISAHDLRSIVFTRNATEAINIVAQSWGRKFLKAGDEIIISALEHHANIVPWHMLREQIGIVIKVIPLMADGSMDLAAYEALLTDRTKLVSVVHVSNATGNVNNISHVKLLANKFNPDIKFLFDGSQAVVHMPVSMAGLDPDFYVFTGHKLYGPTGVGVLYGKYDLLEAMDPYQGGGDMIETVSFDAVTYKSPPAKFEAGTPAIAEVIGLGAAVDYLSIIGMDKIAAHERELLIYATEQLKAIDGLKIYGTAPDKGPIISFTLDGAHPADIAMMLDQMHIAVRTGHHCCMPLMQRLGIEGTVRASFGLYNTREDIDRLVSGLYKVKSIYK